MGNLRATELRIGNWVYISDNYTLAFYKQETQINIHNMMYLCGETKEPLDFTFEPIPLTEEWLLKFGFEKKKDNYNRYYFSIDGMDIKIDGDEFATEVGECLYKTIKYVHQLQNLYFALNDEELTMK